MASYSPKWDKIPRKIGWMVTWIQSNGWVKVWWQRATSLPIIPSWCNPGLRMKPIILPKVATRYLTSQQCTRIRRANLRPPLPKARSYSTEPKPKYSKSGSSIISSIRIWRGQTKNISPNLLAWRKSKFRAGSRTTARESTKKSWTSPRREAKISVSALQD